MLVIPLLFILAFVQLFISLGVLTELRRTKSVAQKLFFAVSTSFLLWTLSLITLTFVDDNFSPSNINFFNMVNKIAYVLGLVSVTWVLVLILNYPLRTKINAYYKLLIGTGFVAGLLSASSQISGSFLIENGKLQYNEGKLSIIFLVVSFFILINVIIVALISLKRSPDYLARKQTKTLLTGLTLTITHGLIFILILAPMFSNNLYLYAIGYLAPYYFIGFTLYSLVTQRLLDIRLVVARSVGYAISLGALILFAAFVIFVPISAVSHSVSNEVVSQALEILLAILLAVTYPYVKKRFDTFTRRLFYRDAYDTQEFLNDFNQVIVSTIDLSQLLARAGKTIEDYLKPESIAFAIRDSEENHLRIVSSDDQTLSLATIEQIRTLVHDNPEKFLVTDMLEASEGELKNLLQESSIGVLSRITTNANVEGNGYIIMGYKKSGNMYNTQDTSAMEIVSNELAIAMQNALQFEEIQKFNVTLQDKIDDATRKLKRTNDKLKQMDETKDEFISMASHQLRTPLTSVKGYLSMVLEGDAGDINEMQHKLLDQAFISSQRMVYLIADLLNVSRLRTGKFVIEPSNCNLADAVEGEIHQLIETAEARGLTLTYKKPEDFPSLPVDETKLRQVIMNFMDNAIYYSTDGGHINVELKDKGDSIEYTVSDDGIGVPKAEQHHLFTKFYRAGNAKKARPDGTGLGLFMAKKVVVAHGGSIIFKSDTKGSVFGFNFQKAKLQALANSINAANETTHAAPIAATKADENASEEPAKEAETAPTEAK